MRRRAFEVEKVPETPPNRSQGVRNSRQPDMDVDSKETDSGEEFE